jgi:HSP20 family protein
MALVRYDTWYPAAAIEKDLSQFMNRLREQLEDVSVVNTEWVPLVDVKEEKDRFVIRADIPGVDPKNIEVTMENGVLSIRGERTAESVEEREKYHRMERVTGVFHHRFALPETANPEGIQARGRDGVLEITIPKHEKLRPRRISVES